MAPNSIPDRFPRVDVVYIPPPEIESEPEAEPEHEGEKDDEVEPVPASGEDPVERSTGLEPVQGN